MILFQVTFKNDASGEYAFYFVTFKVLTPGVIGSVDLTTAVRQSVSHVITISNPLFSIVNFQTSCSVQEVNMPPQFAIPAQSEVCLSDVNCNSFNIINFYVIM